MSERWIWDRSWQSDRIASCFDGAGARNYGEPVAAGWQDFFSGLAEKSRIIDLCTGNGAIALIAASIGRSENKHFSITAVDQADIDPPAYVTRHREALAAIRFQGGTEVEALPFADKEFDVAVSQYGLEYADLERAVPELGRVLARGGQARLVVHAADGIVAAGSKRVVADADLLLNDIGLIAAARRCFEDVGQVEAGDTSPAAREKADEAFAAFRTALKRTGERIAGADDKMMFHNSGAVLLDAFRARGWAGLPAVLAKVDTVEGEILAHRGRLQALIDAALDERGAKALAERLEAAGAVESDSARLESPEGLIGYVIRARFA